MRLSRFAVVLALVLAPAASRATSKLIVIEPSSPPPSGEDDSNGSEKAPRSSRHDRERDAIKGLFWEARAPENHSKTGGRVFLLGSIHVGNDSFYPLPPAIQKAFDSSDTLAVEVDLRPGHENQDATRLLHAGSYAAGANYSLRNAVTKSCYSDVQEAADALAIPMTKLSLMKPWMATFVLENNEARLAGLKPELGLDLHFLKLARGHKDIDELEGLDAQIDFFNDLPKDEQAAMLCATAKESKSFKADMDRMMRAWKSGDAGSLAAILDESAKDPEVKEALNALIANRNSAMVQKIAPYFASEGNHFVVVGAAHLVGPSGIVKLLQDQKYIVEQK
jgi:uncharacterized protein YbaP (TraB family)